MKQEMVLGRPKKNKQIIIKNKSYENIKSFTQKRVV